MDRTPRRRLVGTAALALLVGASAASPAAAAQRCAAPATTGGWHSCLTVSHRTIDGGPELRLTKARPRLVMRSDRCPARGERKTVVIRTDKGRRLGRARVSSRCRRGVSRWIVNLRLNVDLREGVVVRSRWSGVADSGKAAPAVELGSS